MGYGVGAVFMSNRPLLCVDRKSSAKPRVQSHLVILAQAGSHPNSSKMDPRIREGDRVRRVRARGSTTSSSSRKRGSIWTRQAARIREGDGDSERSIQS